MIKTKFKFPSTIITVEDRLTDYLAYDTANRHIWASGRTVAEALGNLALWHASHFNMAVDIQPPAALRSLETGSDPSLN